MNRPLRVLLIGNYFQDRQESMIRFFQTLHAALATFPDLEISTLSPPRIFARADRDAHTGLNKWRGYIDKFIIFPILLWSKKSSFDIVHICDHSNAFYARFTGRVPTLITCHDMLTIRGARGEETFCRPTKTGVLLQKTILSSLPYAQHLASVSQATLDDVKRLLPSFPAKQLSLIHNGLYQTLPAEATQPKALPAGCPFIFHVGSNIERKNRPHIIAAFARAREKQSDLHLVFAGQEIPKALWTFAKELRCEEAIIDLGKISEDELAWLYRHSQALFFPSYSEGFGLPILEAIESSCPVIASDIPTHREILGQDYPLFPPDDVHALTQEIIQVQNSNYRQHLRHLISQRAGLFSKEKMVASYHQLYRKVVNG